MKVIRLSGFVFVEYPNYLLQMQNAIANNKYAHMNGHGGHGSKMRKSREHRSRSQEWPDVPDVGKIDEKNPEVLAQKILETGKEFWNEDTLYIVWELTMYTLWKLTTKRIITMS